MKNDNRMYNPSNKTTKKSTRETKQKQYHKKTGSVVLAEKNENTGSKKITLAKGFIE